LQSFQDKRQREPMAQGAFLAYRDAQGRVIDFHALRHTYISRVVRSGASAKAAQTLARHSTVQLTVGRYAHANLYDLMTTVEALPPLAPAWTASELLAATGTDGRQISLGPNLGPQPAISGDFQRQAETQGVSAGIPLSAAKSPEKHGETD